MQFSHTQIGMDLGFPRVSSSGHCEITEKRDDVCQESACGSLSPSADEQCLVSTRVFEAHP